VQSDSDIHAESSDGQQQLPEAVASMSEPSFDVLAESSVPSATASPGPTEPPPRAPEPPLTSLPTSSRRKVRKSPSIRLLDEYGRERDESRNEKPTRKEESVSMRTPSGSPATPWNKSAVRILDAMGREVEEAPEQNDSEDTVMDFHVNRTEALARVKKAVSDLQEGLSEVDKCVSTH
jgi:serine/arginine repetitive matrix protein 2